MKRIIASLLLLIISSNSFATECPTPVKLLEEGAATPCRGFLFSPQKELEVRLIKLNFDLAEQEIDFLQKSIVKFKAKDLEYENIIAKEEQKSELWRVRAEDSTAKLVASESGRTTRDVLFFVGGVLTVVLAAYAVGQVAGK